jgi:Tfp pilus assembly protein PilF
VIEQNPNHACAHNDMGYIIDSMGKHEEAIYWFRKAIIIDPTYADAHNNFGYVMQKMGNPERAV